MHEFDRRPPLPEYRDLLAYYHDAFSRYQQDQSEHAERVWRSAADLLDASLLMLPGRLSLGHIFTTPGSLTTLERAEQLPAEFLLPHKQGDWGDLDPHDLQINENALHHRGRVASIYRTRTEEPLWVITDAGWEVTTLLIPEEY